MIFGKKNKTHPESSNKDKDDTQSTYPTIIETPTYEYNTAQYDTGAPQWATLHSNQQSCVAEDTYKTTGWSYYNNQPNAVVEETMVHITQPSITPTATTSTTTTNTNTSNTATATKKFSTGLFNDLTVPGVTTSNQTNKNKNYIPVHTRQPIVMDLCPHCQQHNVATRPSSRYTAVTYASMVTGAIVFLPLAVVPVFCGPLKQTNHHCTACGAKVGRVKTLRFTSS